MLSESTGSSLTVPVDIAPFLDESPVVIAVSGGSDSTALLQLASHARRVQRPDCRLIAVTVDHGLRAESADEAQRVGALAAELGLEHRIIRWEGEKPQRGVQASARNARMEILAQAASEAGARMVMTGHTLDDQAETVLMRSARGDGIGLAGIAPATLFRNSVWFVRPLLAQRRAALRTVLKAGGTAWIDDPSNENTGFERVRTRKMLAEDPALFDRMLAHADKAAAARIDLASNSAMVIERHANLVDAATIALDASFLEETDGEAAVHVLRLLLATAGVGAHLPDIQRTTALLEALRSGLTGASLANAHASVKSGAIRITHDRRGKAGPALRLRSPFDELLPSFDVAAAHALSRLLGNPLPPALPAT